MTAWYSPRRSRTCRPRPPLRRALAAAAVADPPAAGRNVSSAADGSGQFEGLKTIAYVSGSFGANQAEAVSTLYVLWDQEFHFVLTAAHWGLPSASGVDMSIRDSAGNPVFSMLAAAGATEAVEGYLDAGAYTVEFTRDAAGPGGVLRFELGGVTLPLADTTQDPAEESSTSTLAEYSFYWLPPHSVSPGIAVQQPPASLTSTSPDNGSTATVSHLLVSMPAETVELPPSQANSAPAPPAAGYPATGFPSAAAIPADPQSVAANASLGILTSTNPPADDFSTAADGRVAAAAPLPPRVTGRPSTSAVGDDLLRELSVACAAATAEPTAVGTIADAPLEASSATKPVPESSLKADSASLFWQWLAVVNENLTVSWKLAPVVVALGWCAWQARASRKRASEAEREFHPLLS